MAAAAIGMVIRVPSEEDFEQAEGAQFLEAPDVAQLGDALRNRYSQHFGFMADFDVMYLWRREGGKSQGAEVRAFCAKVSGLAKYFAGTDFVIWLAADHLRAAHLTPAQMEALVFHELCHIDADEKGKPTIRKHDFEGFRAEIAEYGFWQDELSLMKNVVQGRLFADEKNPSPTHSEMVHEIVSTVADIINAQPPDVDGVTVRAWVGGAADRPDDGAEEGDEEVAAAVAEERVPVSANGRGAE